MGVVVTRAWHIREIMGHLDALVDDLDGTGHPCESCGLTTRTNWSEAQAKAVLKENRAKYERMLAQEWAKKVNDEPPWDSSGVAQNTEAMVRAMRKP